MNSRMMFRYVCVAALLVQATNAAYAADVRSTDTVKAAVCYTRAEGQQHHQDAIEVAKKLKADPTYKAPKFFWGPDSMFAFKQVTAKWTQTQETDTSPIKLDASSSTVPSGKAEIFWNGDPTGPVTTTADGSQGSYRNFRLAVFDTVCGVSAFADVRVTSK